MLLILLNSLNHLLNILNTFIYEFHIYSIICNNNNNNTYTTLYNKYVFARINRFARIQIIVQIIKQIYGL